MFLNTETKEYPRFQGDLELLGWVAGQSLPENWVEVQAVPFPTNIPANHKTVEAEPVEINGIWTQVFDVVPMTAEEIERRDAPKTASDKLAALGFTEFEIAAIRRGILA